MMLNLYLDYIQDTLTESEKKFWKAIYKGGETHWMDKEPSNLVRKIISKYKSFNRVLEVGCASGVDTILLASIVKDKIIGIDLVDEAIDEAKNNLKEQPKNIRDKIIFEVGDVEKLKYSDNSFDFVYSLSVLHSTDTHKSLKEIHRVLDKDGDCTIHILIGGGKEPINKNKFLEECQKYFEIVEQQEVSKKDEEGVKHRALILFLKSMKE